MGISGNNLEGINNIIIIIQYKIKNDKLKIL